ncbi:molecular chaperone [Bacillus sp. OK048]|uniref:TorD/DmsD family molecular chaperone n=1 Tax=Bacillus sp. OK048 TaxID=1882761 RepID=UPI000885A8FC|nr:molecular chaperone TorD family protein [Bacillus sp. OK048]SDM60610.1 Nitrate reductase delta subunit [Bacillus sp. OK048]
MTIIQETVMKQEERLFYYQLFCHYYRGDLLQLPPEKWGQVVRIIKEYQNTSLIDEVAKSLRVLEEVKENTIQTFEHDYNRLFVGPNKLLASPFESSYRNYEGNVLQQETLNVRNFYHFVGVKVANEGQIPDDHIQFELEFILHVLSDQTIQENRQIYKMFLEKHLMQWIFKHCKKIIENSQNPITHAMAVLLKEFLQLERIMMEGGNEDVN